MDSDIQFPVYNSVIQYIAKRFFDDPRDPHPPAPDEQYRALVDLLKNEFFEGCTTLPAWEIWTRINTFFKKQFHRFEATLHPHMRLRPDELSFLTELGLHIYFGRAAIRMPFECVEHISSTVIDRGLLNSSLAQSDLPYCLWVEWYPAPTNAKPWIQRTVALLISKMVYLDAPPEIIRNMLDKATALQSSSFIGQCALEIANMAGDGTPCIGYTVTAAQKVNDGYRFVTAEFGHQQCDPVYDLLALHKDVGDKDRPKFKETQQVWTNVAIRILLATISCRWLSQSKRASVVCPCASGFEGKTGVFAADENNGIQLLTCEDPLVPFRIET